MKKEKGSLSVNAILSILVVIINLGHLWFATFNCKSTSAKQLHIHPQSLPWLTHFPVLQVHRKLLNLFKAVRLQKK